MKIEIEVSRALGELADSVSVIGPVSVDSHINYVVTGLADTQHQRTNLSWCILGFIGNIIEADMAIDSAIGEGKVATDNLQRALKKRLGVGNPLELPQKERKRDPLLQELISHALLLIHQRQEKLSAWLGTIQAISMPHLSPNDSGIDLIAIGSQNGIPIPIIGEVKAYEKAPWGGLNDACGKFSEILDGDYDDEIRGALKSLTQQNDLGFTKEQLANNIWREQGHFGALVGHDSQYGQKGEKHIDVNFSSRRAEVLKQNADNLFFISSPFSSMRSLFDDISSELLELSTKLSETI